MKTVIARMKNEMTQPTAEEFRGWLDQSVGKYFKADLEESMYALMENWANGYYNNPENSEETLLRNSEALGKVQQIAEILSILEENSSEEEDDSSEEDKGEVTD